MASAIGAQGRVTLPIAASVYLIKTPNEVENAYTVKSEAQAQKVFKSATLGEIEEFKAFLKDLNMTSISTRQLTTIGSKLKAAGMINESVAAIFAAGNRDLDASGEQRNIDLKYNAVALFNQLASDPAELARTLPGQHARNAQPNIKAAVIANHVLNALAYFAHSPGQDLEVREQA